MGNLAVEPEMDAGDGRGLEVADHLTHRSGLGCLRENPINPLKGQRQHQVIEHFFALADAESHSRRLDTKLIERAAKLHLTAAGLDIVPGGIVQSRQWDGWNAHMPRGRRLHGFPYYLGSGGNRYPVQIFTEGADQDRLPKSLNCARS